MVMSVVLGYAVKPFVSYRIIHRPEGLLTPIPVPRAISRLPDGLLIEWPEPGHAWLYPARMLRQACPCAVCVDELTGRQLLDPDSVAGDLAPEALSLVGAYGLRVRWSDGHGTGIYTFERLRAMCGCPRCARG